MSGKTFRFCLHGTVNLVQVPYSSLMNQTATKEGSCHTTGQIVISSKQEEANPT